MELRLTLVVLLAAHGTLALAAPETVLGPTGVPLERLYNTSVQLPGTTEPLNLEGGAPVPCGDGVVFRAKEFSAIRSWAYRVTSTSLEVFVDEETIIPGTSEEFFRIADIQCIAEGEYSFVGIGEPPSGSLGGAYSGSPGGSITLIQAGGVLVGGNDIRTWEQLNASEHGAALLGHRGPVFSGVMIGLKPTGQDPIYVADQSQILPGQTQTVSGYDSPRMMGSAFVFRAHTVLSQGLYRWSEADGFSVLVDTETPVPGSSETFTGVGSIAVLAEGVAFSGGFSGGAGIFLVDEQGQIEPFVLPGETTVGGETLLAAFIPSGAGHFIAFRGVTDATAPRQGVFVRTPDGLIYRIVSEGDILDGRQVNQVFGNADDRSVAIRVDTFVPDVDQNIYRATFVNTAIDIPALSAGGRAVLVVLVVLLALWAIRQRKLRAAR